MTYKELYTHGTNCLAGAQIAEASLDARLLLEHVCGTDRNHLLAHGDKEVAENFQTRYETLLQRRAGRIPLQHILGYQDFMGLSFRVNENVLIPRQDTEILVEEALRFLRDGFFICDMCTGSGAILISLLHYSNDCTGVGVDISHKALAVAKQNAADLLGEKNANAAFVQSDLFADVDGRFDMIVSNPPYIASDVIAGLEPEVKDFEPLLALDGGPDGLFVYRRLVQDARAHLKRGGLLFLEIGYDQAKDVSTLLEANGFQEIEVTKDYGGNDRVIRAEYRP